MREWTSKLDLQTRDVANGKTEHSPQRHHAPKPNISDSAEVAELAQLSEHQDERDEEDAGIYIVVEGQFPDVSIHCWHHLLGVDGVQ